MILIKKYSNRRLYDTDKSRYISLEELAATIRDGKDVRVVAAKTEEDLTQATLAQIIFESQQAARLLPTQLLLQLIRLSDDALTEFFGQYVTAALDLYLQAKHGAQVVAPYFPFATAPFTAGNAIARLFGSLPFRSDPQVAPGPPPIQTPGAAAAAGPGAGPEPRREATTSSEVADLRRELEELKASLKTRGAKRSK